MLFDGSAAAYPGPSARGPVHAHALSEGLTLNIDTGGFSGAAAPRGRLHDLPARLQHARAQRARPARLQDLHPDDRAQRAADGRQPRLRACDPAFTVEGFVPGQPDLLLAPGVRGRPAYNPDGGPAGLQFLAGGGVPADGYTDAPHVQQRTIDFTETADSYAWDVDWDVDTTGVQGAPAGSRSDAAGLDRGHRRRRPQARRARVHGHLVTDYQLPLAHPERRRPRGWPTASGRTS